MKLSIKKVGAEIGWLALGTVMCLFITLAVYLLLALFFGLICLGIWVYRNCPWDLLLIPLVLIAGFCNGQWMKQAYRQYRYKG